MLIWKRLFVVQYLSFPCHRENIMVNTAIHVWMKQRRETNHSCCKSHTVIFFQKIEPRLLCVTEEATIDTFHTSRSTFSAWTEVCSCSSFYTFRPPLLSPSDKYHPGEAEHMSSQWQPDQAAVRYFAKGGALFRTDIPNVRNAQMSLSEQAE